MEFVSIHQREDPQSVHGTVGDHLTVKTVDVVGSARKCTALSIDMSPRAFTLLLTKQHCIPAAYLTVYYYDDDSMSLTTVSMIMIVILCTLMLNNQ